MTFTQERQKKVLIALAAVLALLMAYRIITAEKPKTAPLTYVRGAVAGSTVRPGPLAQAGADPLNVLFERRGEKFPGVSRDIFRLENPAPKKPKVSASQPAVHVPTPEELAAEQAKAAAAAAELAAQAAVETARVDMSKFRFLGYLTDPGKESSLFLSKDSELFIVKSGDQVLKNYRIKEADKDHVILLDTVTRTEVRLELSGGGDQTPPKQRR
jgi:type II secretory pathway component PulC